MVAGAVVVHERDYSAAERRRYAASGVTMADGSFPMLDLVDLEAAVHLVGQASDPAAAKRHVIKRAQALGLVSRLPAECGVREDASARAELEIRA